MRARPRHRAQADHDQQRRRPDDQLELGRVIPVGRISRRLVARAIPPRENADKSDHRDDDQQHQAGREDDEIALLQSDVAHRVEHDHVATAEQRGERKRGRRAAGRRETRVEEGRILA